MTTALPLAFYKVDFDPFLGPHWGNFGIRYYGLSYLMGFVVGAWLMYRYWKAGRSPLSPEMISDFIVALVIGVMLGGRLGSFLLYHPGQLIHNPLSFFYVWEGGMASHGGMAGVAVALWWFSRKKRVRFFTLSDIVVSVAPAGLFFGRIANFINGELWGKPTQVPWAMLFPKSGDPQFPRHPSELYEAALEGLFLLGLMQWRFWKTGVARRHPGQLSGEFLLAYAVVRAICEVFREPDADVTLILGLSRGTFYSIFLVLGGVALIALARRKSPTDHAGPA